MGEQDRETAFKSGVFIGLSACIADLSGSRPLLGDTFFRREDKYAA